jgi:glycosyltransferase involved in cell wall biosynthesis
MKRLLDAACDVCHAEQLRHEALQSMLGLPHVSVVIPTRQRPKLLMRALDSVFAQTFRRFEVIVVVDGPDDATLTALSTVADSRLRVVVNPHSLTAAGARSVGVSHAYGEWVAFLDDDDEWLPHKLEKQLGFAHGVVLVTCLSRVVTPTATFVWPDKIYDNDTPLDEYLFDRRTPFAGSGFMQTSSYLMPRATYAEARFHSETPHDDWDFVIRLSKRLGVRIETAPEVLVNVYFEEPRTSLSAKDSWMASVAWIDRIRPMVSARAYSGFCLSVAGPRAADERAYSAFLPLLLKAFSRGSPRIVHLLAYLAFWVLPKYFRRRLRASFSTRRISSS